MNRRSVLQNLAAAIVLPLLSACSRGADSQAADTVVPLDKPSGRWRSQLTPAAYAVLFEEHTEPPFSSPLDKEKRDGSYLCAACYLPLFDSAHKYDSGTGWPSFTQPIAGHTSGKKDFRLLGLRTEYHCARCGGHQGHVFDDGPSPRGERWCNNGLALMFVPRGESLPPLRS